MRQYFRITVLCPILFYYGFTNIKKVNVTDKIYYISIILSSLLLISLPGQAQKIIQVEAEGQCRNFTIILSTENLSGCWDIKIDAPCKTQKPDLEWQSCFFYLKEALCSPESRVNVKVQLDNPDLEVQIITKLRQNSTIIEMPFTIRQNCPEEPGDELGFLVAVLLVLIFGYVLVWWRRK